MWINTGYKILMSEQLAHLMCVICLRYHEKTTNKTIPLEVNCLSNVYSEILLLLVH